MTCRYEPHLKTVNGTVFTIPGDKSISHRAIIIGSLASNVSQFSGFLCAEDCVNTVGIFRQLGVDIDLDVAAQTVQIQGRGLLGLSKPDQVLDVGNSGTGIRLITGVLVAQAFSSQLSGDESIQKRPMKRIIDPLSQMGALISGTDDTEDIYPPLRIEEVTSLTGIHYDMPVASAQVKSAVLLSGLFAASETRVTEPKPCRDHTEVMLRSYGADISRDGTDIVLQPGRELRCPSSESIPIPADFSSAAFFVVLGLLMPESRLRLSKIGMNKTRSRFLDVLTSMGADIVLENAQDGIEPYADIIVTSSRLRNITIKDEDIAFIIDEIPLLAVVGMFSEGTLMLRNAGELRYKESDRIAKIVHLVQAFGGTIVEYDDGFLVQGGCSPDRPVIETGLDHRIAMSSVIAACVSGVSVDLDNVDCVKTSFPNFFELLKEL